MKIITDPSFFHSYPGKFGFVPTMGALHEGHISLIHEAKRECDQVVVSIFVNPTQFAPHEDFNRYPRPIERDQEMAEAAGVDVLFLPSVESVYPLGVDAARIHIEGVSDLWEGELRPGHFDGVATVVARLLLIVCPKTTYFGQKDIQQTIIVNRMCYSLGLPGRIKVCPTVRESDGLALSSRNIYLSSKERQMAPLIYNCSEESKKMILDHRLEKASVLLEGSRMKLAQFCSLDYFELVSLDDMRPLERYEKESVLIVAARFEAVRLLDNILI